jgi:hypothetical protein
MTNVALIHLDDEKSVLNISKDLNLKFLGSFTDDADWHVGDRTLKTYKQKREFIATNSGYVFDINIGDRISYKEIYSIVNVDFHKIVNEIEQDYFWICKNYYNLPTLVRSLNNETVLFTTGRCGSNLLKYATEYRYKLTHNHQDYMDLASCIPIKGMYTLLSIVRENFFGFLTSTVIAEHYGDYLIATDNNYYKIKELFESAESFNVNTDDVDRSFKIIESFINILYYIHTTSNTNIYLTTLEQLSKKYPSSTVRKLPYDKTQLINNYNELEQLADFPTQIYKSMYEKLINDFSAIPQEYLK